WQAGYKFLRFEGEHPGGSAYRFHLGSTECTGTVGHITSCARPNRPVIELRGFAPGKTVGVDLSAFMQGIDLTVTSGDGVRGCMSGPDAADCAAAFAAIGLDPQTGRPLTTQHVFSVL
ncbi:MAG: MbnP family protein, partial [Gaiellaceae bacterium]